MDLFKKLLEKYQAKYVSPAEIEKFTQKEIAQNFSIDPSMIQVHLKHGVLFCVTHSVLKAEILTKKKTLLTVVQERFPGKVRDIR